VIRGERLPARDFAAEPCEAFAARYGVSHVVLEEVDRFLTMPWTSLIDNPAPSMQVLREIPVSGLRRGTLHVYRFLSPSPRPQNVLEMAADFTDERARRLDWSTPPWRREREVRP
jgi:hypothetical protein